MDQLSAEQQENLRKTNNERLRIMAAKTGDADDEEIADMDRPALLQLVAQSMVDPREKLNRGAGIKLPPEKSDHVRELEIQLKLKRLEVEAEIEAKRIEAETEKQRLELEGEREKREHELKLAEMGRSREEGENGYDGEERGDPRRPRVETLADRVKRYGSALKQCVSQMPNDATELPQFFESLEAMFRTFEVPDDLRAKLLLPFLSQKAKSVTSRLYAEELED